MKQYLNLLEKTLKEGELVHNERTNTNCLTLINYTMEYDVENNKFPLVTTRKSYWKSAINEMVAYIRGYQSLEDFHKIGVKTWDANCNAWHSSYKKDENDCGIIYGASAKKVGFDYDRVLKEIKERPNDRGIIWNFWNPEYFEQGCLRPCMYSHQFNVVGDKLYLTSLQRENCALIL